MCSWSAALKRPKTNAWSGHTAIPRVGRPGSSGRILSDEPVYRFPDQVGVADVPRVLLDDVDQQTPQAGCPTVGPGAPDQLIQPAAGQRLCDRGAGAGHRVLPERHELLGRILRSRGPLP